MPIPRPGIPIRVTALARTACVAAALLVAALPHDARAVPPAPSAPARAGDAPLRVAAANAAPDTDGATQDRDPELAPSTAPPWNPPQPAPRRRLWEHVLDFPGRVVTLPISALGMGIDAGLLKLEDAGVLRYGTPPAPKGSNGIAIGAASLGDRTGFGGHIGLPPIPPAHWMRLDFSASTLRYENARLLLFKSMFGAELQHDWRPQDQFFGRGLATDPNARSDYAMQRAEARVVVAWPAMHAVTRRDTTVLRAGRLENHGFRAETWLGSRTTVIRRGHESATPSFDQLYPSFADQRDLRADQLRWGGVLRWDGRGGVPHYAHGSLLELSADRLDRPIEALALSSGKVGALPSTRVTLAAQTNVSFMRDPRTLRFSGRLSHLETGRGGGVLLLPDWARLGGDAGLMGYEVGRFTDRDLALGRVDYIFPLEAYAEFDIHGEWGGVYPDVRHDLKLTTLRHSFGAFLRARGPGSVLGRIGVEVSPETTRLEFSLSGGEN
ncbi:MAG TPA: hypothetical protein VFK69_04795 [Candidatus Eisenbacteria bacterium]|nr:hypothetical protein [Candidatus Eisenbacteria bacterium]